MRLIKINYTEHENTMLDWHLGDCTFGNINLIVGKNATGKSRTLNVITGLARILGFDQKLSYNTGNYRVEFDLNGKQATYLLKYKSNKVINETYCVENKQLFTRGKDGIGRINAVELNTDMNFQTPNDEIAALAKRDSIQHPFLDDLYTWARNLHRYDFGSSLGKDKFVVEIKNKSDIGEFTRDIGGDHVVEVFMRGKKKFGDDYITEIKNDMEKIDYHIKEIGLEEIKNISNPAINPIGIFVRERETIAKLGQITLSQGMFRCLSVLIQINYAIRSGHPSCILVDDIGEGLDFERAISLVRLMIEKAKNSSVQLIMATNDRFIMNNVPLEYWIILNRIGGEVISFNYRNSKKVFDEFEFTGLSNFDLFSSKYYLKDAKDK
jgi:energy-coupling factor transporter ATP-binding protein EcfA2